MAYANEWIIMGRLTKDPQGGQTASSKGDPVTYCNASVAVNDPRTKKTTYVEVTVWGNVAAWALQNLHTGDLVYAQGACSLEQREHNGKFYANLKLNAKAFQKLAAPSSKPEKPSRDNNQENESVDDDVPF